MLPLLPSFVSRSCASRPRAQAAARAAGLAYAGLAAAGTVAFFTLFIFFLGNLPKFKQPWLVPSADVGPAGDPAPALILNGALLLLFSLQHSLMARTGAKRALAALMPPALERATYVHAANLAGFLVLLLWQPVPVVLWHVRDDVLAGLLWTLFGCGWLMLFAAAFAIDIAELLGLRQAWAWFQGRAAEPLRLKTAWLYRYLEHPMYVGVVLGFWATPYMTLGHAALAAQLTLYIAFAMRLERRDLGRRFGRAYEDWRAGRRLAPLPPYAGAIAAELSRRLEPVAAAPLPTEMRALLARL